MLGVVENALRMLEILIGEDTGHLNRGELRGRMALSKEAFDRAHLFLAQSGYIGATMGGDTGSCWVAPLGSYYYHEQMGKRLPLGYLAKEVARCIGRRAKTEDAAVGIKSICSELEIDRESYLEAMQELADLGLVEEKVAIDQEPFGIVNLTARGRRAVRSGFKPETPSVTQQIGAIIQGSVSGSTIQAAAHVYQSVLQQSVQTGDTDGLVEAISKMTDEMVEVVSADLTTDQLHAYKTAARDLKEQLHEEEKNLSIFQRVVATLSFFDDLDGTLEFGEKSLRLATRVAPYVLPLLQAIGQLRGHVP